MNTKIDIYYVQEQEKDKENSPVVESSEPVACLWNGVQFLLNAEVCSPDGKVCICKMDKNGLAYWEKTTRTCSKNSFDPESGQDIKEIVQQEEEVSGIEIGPIEEYQAYKDELQFSRMREFQAYAPPNVWGTWVEIDAHGGPVSFTISYTALGATLVLGKVKYYSPQGFKEVEFKNSININTGNAWAAVEICFKGIPLGSIVRGVIY